MLYQPFVFRHPFTMIISGPTGCGKTQFLKNIIRQNLISPIPKEIYYFYGEFQEIFSEFKNVNFIKGLDIETLESVGGKNETLIIIDDLMDDSAKSDVVRDIFTKASHHRNISIILVLQNFFVKGKSQRTITLNSQYIVLFKNPRDKTISMNLGRQMFPSKLKAFTNLFEDATRKPFSYLLIDLKPDTPEELRLLSEIVGEDSYISVYQLK